MSAAIQIALVFVVVATATSYATFKLMPAVWRRGFAAYVASWAGRSGASDATVRRLEAKLSTGGACGSCGPCKACATPAAEIVGAEKAEGRRIPIRAI